MDYTKKVAEYKHVYHNNLKWENIECARESLGSVHGVKGRQAYKGEYVVEN